MIPWAIIILILDVVLYFLLRSCQCINTAAYIVIFGIAIAVIGILIRIYRKTKRREFEKLTEKVESLRSENKELLERIAAIREREILERTGEDL